MGWLLAGFIIALIGLILMVAGKALAGTHEQFEAGRKPGHAEVMGYDREEHSSHYTLMVRVLEHDDGKTYGCKAGRGDVTRYPKGTVLDVWYAPVRVMGISTLEVHLAEDPPADAGRIAAAFRNVGRWLTAAAAIPAIIGIIVILL